MELGISHLHPSDEMGWVLDSEPREFPPGHLERKTTQSCPESRPSHVQPTAVGDWCTMHAA